MENCVLSQWTRWVATDVLLDHYFFGLWVHGGFRGDLFEGYKEHCLIYQGLHITLVSNITMRDVRSSLGYVDIIRTPMDVVIQSFLILVAYILFFFSF